MFRTRAALTVLVVAACRPTSSPTPARGTFPAGWHFAAGAKTTFAPNAMVASNSELASAAGVEILRRGGNAVDAAVAVGFALAVTHPEAGNIGGGGFMLIRLADGRAAALDYREVAPFAATRDMYVDSTDDRTDESTVGHRAVGVPGSVAGLAEALRAYGTLPLSDVIAPAIRLADSGFAVDTALHRSLDNSRSRIGSFAGSGVFLSASVRPPAVGAHLRQPDLARTLRLIARHGPAEFYSGTIADSLTAEMRRGGGLITREDLRRYRPVWREPLRGTYRGYALLTMPPVSSGGVAMIEAMNVLETYDRLPAFGGADYTHRLASALQRAFIDRNTKLGDPAFVRVPVDELTSKAYARRLRATIDDRRATPTAALAAGGMREGTETTHYSIVDAAGNAVAATTTLNDLYGSGVYVRGAGFFLNDEMDDFAARPGQPNLYGLVEGAQNAIAPGKRMLSSMSPTIVLDPVGKVLLVVGSRGGPRIITSTVQVVLNVLDHRMSLADAVRAPRIHYQAWPDKLVYEPGGLTAATVDSLARWGYATEVATYAPGGFVGRVHAVMRVTGGWEGISDPRTSGGAVGY